MPARLLTVLFALALAPAAHAAASAPTTPPALALLHTEASSPLLEPRIESFDTLLFAELSARPGIILVEREALGAVLGELHLQARAATSQATAAQIGRWTGARIVVSARATARGPGLAVAARIMGAETGAVVVADVTMDAPEHFASGASALAGKIAAAVEEKRGQLLPPPEDEAARLETLRAAFANRPPRPIALAIRETRGAAAGPAAHPLVSEEFARIWEAVGGHASREADSATSAGALLLRADARAEPGLRHGEFFSARGHVSLVVIDPAAGRELIRDHQTEIALEGSSSSALDAALRRAARALAFRILLSPSTQSRP